MHSFFCTSGETKVGEYVLETRTSSAFSQYGMSLQMIDFPKVRC